METYILHIETASKICSVALSLNGKILQLLETDDLQFEHTEKLFPFIKKAIEKSEITFADLSAVAVSKGPGSYTGLRIGVSAAKGLCFGLNIPMIGVCTLKAMANGVKQNYFDNEIFCPMLDAKRMEVYTAIFDKNLGLKKTVEAIIIDENFCSSFLKNNKIVFFGDGLIKAREILTQNKNAVFFEDFKLSSASMVEIAHINFDEKLFEDIAYFEPSYLKEFVRTTKIIS